MTLGRAFVLCGDVGIGGLQRSFESTGEPFVEKILWIAPALGRELDARRALAGLARRHSVAADMLPARRRISLGVRIGPHGVIGLGLSSKQHRDLPASTV